MANRIEEELKKQVLSNIQPTPNIAVQNTVTPISQAVNSTNTGVKVANVNGENQYTGNIKPAETYTEYLFGSRPGMLAGLTPQQQQSFRMQEQENLKNRSVVKDLFSSGVNKINELAASTWTNPIVAAQEGVRYVADIFQGRNAKAPLAKAVEAIPKINPSSNVQQQAQEPLQMPNLNSAEQEYLRQLQGLQQKPGQFQPTQVNLGRPEFNQQNLQQNIQNALNTPGAKMDTNTYNQLLSQFMAGTQERLSQSDIEKKAIEDRIAKLYDEAKNEITDAWKNQDFGTAIMNIALAGRKNKQAEKLQEALNKMTASDRTAAQTELMRMQEQMAGTEKERAAFDAGFAQKLAQTGLSAENQAELKRQEFDQKMKELGIGVQLSDIKDKRQADKELSAYNRELAKLAILTPEQRLANQLATAKTGLIDAALTSLNPNATPQQKKQAEFNAKIYNIPIQALSTQKEQELKPVVVDGEIVNIDTRTGRAVGRILSTEQKAKLMAERDVEVQEVLNNKYLTKEKKQAEIDKINEKYRF